MDFDDEEVFRVAQAVVMGDSDDSETRQNGFRELLKIIDERLEHSLPYRMVGNLLISSGEVSEWENARYCIICSAKYPDKVMDHSKDERYAEAYNMSMKLGLMLKNAGMYEDATDIFILAGRYDWSIEEPVEEREDFGKTFVDLAFETAEEADDDPHGPTTRKVFDFIEELRG